MRHRCRSCYAACVESRNAIRIDARGLRCPLPVLRLRKLAEGHRGIVELLTDDPAADADVPAFARERGWRIEAREAAEGATVWRLAVG
jgi:tRNA 2-thiouridine synthesizing protein A